MSTVKDLLKNAKRREETEPVCLRGDLAGQYDALEKALEQLPKNTRLGGDPERQRIAAEMERVRAEMQDGTVSFTLRALSDTAYQELVDQHPPRQEGSDVNSGDAQVGFNRATFFRALIQASTVEPPFDAEDWDLLFTEGLSRGQAVKLRTKALEINGGDVSVPFSYDDSSENPD